MSSIYTPSNIIEKQDAYIKRLIQKLDKAREALEICSQPYAAIKNGEVVSYELFEDLKERQELAERALEMLYKK